MQKARVWLSYDLGVGGDYEGLYTFLDTLGAKECGDSLAFFEYEYESDLERELKDEIREKVNLNKNDRVYIIAIYNTQEGNKSSWRSFYTEKERGRPGKVMQRLNTMKCLTYKNEICAFGQWL